MADERQIPIYAVEFKAPHKVTIPEWWGLHQINLARDVINQEGDTFEFHATYLVAAVDVQADDELRLHRTAIGQVLAFTLQALAAKAPSQEWHDAAYDKLETWDVEYLDVLRKIPETLPEDAQYTIPCSLQTRYLYSKHSSTEGSGSDEESHSPSIAAAARSGSSRGRGNNRQSTKESESKRAGQNNKQTSRKDGHLHDPTAQLPVSAASLTENLDQECPNWKLHGGQRHSIGPQEFTRGFTANLPKTETMGLNSFTSVVGQVTSSKLPFYHTGTLWSLKLPQWRSSIAFKRRRTIIVTSGAYKEIKSPSVLAHLRHKSYIGTMAN
ncbi:hypothetical protein PDIDSM_5317 [Penicillium digitatum]|nr:hypothetical protein PDIDSM_5317 [Penicillium digitatum]